ncbi:MAG TPA: sigma 54-interacting transcriptional regulator [Blastocatellia bacterium]|nr:sigma 54-interacting transcriptional regulator [Blastocatellia bacterium]
MVPEASPGPPTGALALERKLKMYEAREALLSRIGSETFSVINLDHFLQATVTEVGKMMEVDRCDVMTLTSEGLLRITHEYRAETDSDELPSLLGAEVRADIDRLQEGMDLYSPHVIDDTASSELPPGVLKLVERLGSKSVLIVPVTFNLQLLGMIGLHHCRRSYHWKEEEVSFVKNLAQQIAIGYRYTHIYTEKEREARITKALLEIANDINTGSDFTEVTERILDRSLDLLRTQAACLAILDANNSEIHFSNLRTAAGSDSDILKRPSLKFPILELLPKTVGRGQMLKILGAGQHEYARAFLTDVFSAGAAIIVPIVIDDKIFGALIVLWSEPQQGFANDVTALALGIADQLAIAISKARLSAEVLRLRRELEHAQSEHSDIGFVGKSDNIMRCLKTATYVADSYTTVLLQGESGTGKEMLADLIQSRSSRAAGSYIKINCGAIPETLLESELFGHEKGAFTDARARRIGKFEEADGGTLFLDEVGEMSLSAQVRLLRVLQNGEITRVGGNDVIKTDVRVIAASNADLEKAVREGRFRQDLFYRLNVYPIKLPPLRERHEDIPLLATHFLEIYKKRSNKNITGINRKALTWLRRYDWPGNVRELENAMERAVIVAQGRMIGLEDLPHAVRGAETSKSIELEVGSTIDEAEKRMIMQTLAYTRGDRSRAAQILGIGRKTLYRKLQKYRPEDDQ